MRRVRITIGALLAIALLTAAGCSAIPEAQTAPADYGVTESATAPAEPPSQPAPEPAPAAEPPVSPEPSAASTVRAEKATVVRVVDGDTAIFDIRGEQERVRFIGVDTPEATTKTEPYGAEATAYTSKALPPGKTVWLEQDIEPRDRYGRLLAYVWLTQPTSGSDKEIRAQMLNARLALDGYAQQMTIQPNSKYADHFTRHVREAREAGRGLWGLEAPGASAGTGAGAGSSAGTREAAYIGNANSMKFHRPACSSVGQMAEHNKVALSSRSEAVSGGYVPCKRCNP